MEKEKSPPDNHYSGSWFRQEPQMNTKGYRCRSHEKLAVSEDLLINYTSITKKKIVTLQWRNSADTNLICDQG